MGQAGACPQFRSATVSRGVQPKRAIWPRCLALNDTTRAAYRQSASVHCDPGFAFKAASAGSRARVLGNEAHFARGSRTHARMAPGLMFTSSRNRASCGQALTASSA